METDIVRPSLNSCPQELIFVHIEGSVTPAQVILGA